MPLVSDAAPALESLAIKAKEYTYSPYSKYPVGAAIETEDGSIFLGANVENASYGLTECAERVAAFVAVISGAGRFKRVAIATNTENPGPPCGACRQVLYEFGGKDLEVIAVGSKGTTKTWKLGDLLPDAFGPENLFAA